MDITIDQSSLALFLTVLIPMITIIAKQWHADRKIYRILEVMETRQETFHKTIEAFNDFMQENSKEHAVLMERLTNMQKDGV